MIRVITPGVLAVAALLACLTAVADATPRPLREWVGVMADGPLIDGRADPATEAAVMASSGVGHVRLALYWREVEAEPGVLQWERYDAMVAAYARSGLRVMPVLLRAPGWATGGDLREGAIPDSAAYARFCAAAVARYGRRGSFWAERPDLPRVPILDWQVWNEPDIGLYWTRQPDWAPAYADLLRAAHAAIKSAEPSARVVTAGLSFAAWVGVQRLYEAGARGTFDAVAIHPYLERPQDVVRAAFHTRAMMARYGDVRMPLILSEVSYPSSRDFVPWHIATDEAGQAALIGRLLTSLRRARRPLGIDRVFHYTWLSPPLGGPSPFDYSGLRRLEPDGRVVDKPVMGAFRAAVGPAAVPAAAVRRRAASRRRVASRRTVRAVGSVSPPARAAVPPA